MEFRSNQAIFLQIADYICDQILSGKFPVGERIVSTRELAIELSVNPNTAMRAYEHLQQQGIIFNRRGMGFFVDDTALDKIREMRRQRFYEQDLPDFIKKIKQLGLDYEVVMKSFTVLLRQK